MSDSLPENPISGTLKVVKLVTGEELIGLVNDTSEYIITLKFPALLQNYVTKSPEGDVIEFIKLVNYLYNIKDFSISVNRNSVVYYGTPSDDLYKMYHTYITVIQENPKSVISHGMTDESFPDNGLQLLNDLFNNEDFVNFVNDLIDNFQDEVEIEEEDEEDDVELIIEASEDTEPEKQPKKKKRRKIKPETNKMPYNPESPPENPESWSDDPKDYI